MSRISRAWDSLCFRIASLFRRSQIRAEMEDELRCHIELRAADLERSGLTRREAERRARIEFGAEEKFQQEIQSAIGANFVETWFQDARLSLRQLRKSPGFTTAATLTLALAICANAVVFGVLDGLVLRPLDVPRAESLYGTNYNDNPAWQSYANYVDLRDGNRVFEDLAAFSFALGVNFDAANDAVVANGFATSGNYFSVLGISPYLGRFFNAADERGSGSAPYVILTYAYWHSRFHDDRQIIGRAVQLNKHQYTVLGVSPPGFQGSLIFLSPDFFIPMVNEQDLGDGIDLKDRSNVNGVFETFGHLKPGVTVAQATADVDSVAAALAGAYPKQVARHSTNVSRVGLDAFGPGVRAFVASLMLLAGLILLAACTNLGSLFAARAADRAKEVALRLALGSNRKRIVRQLLTEAMILSCAGGLLGALGSFALLRKLSTWHPIAGTPVHLPVSPDSRLFLFALFLAIVSALLFAIIPVRQVLRVHPYQIVKAGPDSGLGRRFTARDALVVIQIAVCAVLVTSSLVAVRGLLRSLHGDLGIEPQNTMLSSVNLAMAGYSGDAVPAIQRRMIDSMKTIPGVDAVGFVNGYPPLAYTAGTRENIFRQQTTDLRPGNAAGSPFRYDISAGYFEAAGTTLLAGRSLSWQDDKKAPAVAVVNRLFAQQLFGSVPAAIGHSFKLQDGTLVQIVGVVENGKYQFLTEAQAPAMFLSFLRTPNSSAFLVVRSRRDPAQLASAMRGKILELDAGLPVDNQTWSNLLETVLFPSRVATLALGVMGLMGAMLSITGIFGMASWSVSKRMRELGIRMALGAKRTEVLRAALGRPLKLLAFGSLAGLFLGLLGTRVLGSIVYQASPRDPLVLAGAVVAMALLGLLATWIPAQRALSFDPLLLLRED